MPLFFFFVLELHDLILNTDFYNLFSPTIFGLKKTDFFVQILFSNQ